MTNRPVFFASLAAAAISLVGCAANRPAPEPVLTAQQRALNAQSFDKVWQTIRDRHWDATLGGVDWDAAKAELRPKAESAQTMSQARASMQELIGRLKQSHFGIIPADAYSDSALSSDTGSGSKPAASGKAGATAAKPAPSAAAASNNAAPVVPADPAEHDGSTGMTIRVVGDDALVTVVRQGSAAYTQGVKPGWIVRSVRGRPVAPTIATIRQAMGDKLLLEATLAQTIQARLAGPVGESVPVEFVDGQNRGVQMAITLGPPQGTAGKFGNLPTIYYTFDANRPAPDIGYIAFSVFLNPAELMPQFNKAIDDYRETKGLIIDLRGNIGGIGAMAMGIGGHFVTEPDQKLGTMITRDTKLNFVLNPRPRPYEGKVAVLIDGLSLSTSEILAGGLQSLKLARVFGTRSGGAALPSTVEILPNGDRFQYAFANYTNFSGESLEGHGVVPDVVVAPARDALLKGQDPVIQAAIDWIRTPAKP
jgi:carboxyl-terminal processing protease